MPQREPRRLTTTRQVAAALGFLLSLICQGAHAQPRGVAASSLDLLDLVVVEPLLPLLAGAGLFKLTRSHLIAAGLPALAFGAWSALSFYRLAVDDPLSGALFELAVEGIPSGLLALAGSGYMLLVGVEARRLGTRRTVIAHGVGLGFAAIAFVLLLVMQDKAKVALGLYLVLLALSFGLSTATGSFGGVVATMAFALFAMMHGVTQDEWQAYIVIIYVLPALVLLVAAAGLGRLVSDSLRAHLAADRDRGRRP